MNPTRIFGIDLGTTYSCISYVDDTGRPVVTPNFEGDLTTPSAVYFESDDNIVVGKEAKNVSKLYPDRVVEHVKRNMGDPTFSYEVDGKQYKPESISSFILRKLVSDASQSIGEEISDVVITCPAYFGINHREATKNAGKLAGLNVRHVLNEPTAAAICYGLDKSRGDQTVLVYDLGGGTFDVTVIAITDGNIQVIVTGGDHNLGGKDWDDNLTEHLASEFQAEHPDKSNPLDDPQSRQEIAKASEDAKKALTVKEKTGVTISHDGERTRVELTREKFEEITADLLDQTIQLTQKLLDEARDRGHGKIDQILMVGGSSKMPAVMERMKEQFGDKVQIFEPDLAVAKGAALMGVKILAGEMIKEELASELGKEVGDIDLETVDRQTLEAAAQTASAKSGGRLRLPSKDLADMAQRKIGNVASKSFGLVVVQDGNSTEEFVAFLIHNNTPVPAEVTETDFGTVRENQRSVNIRVMEQAGQAESANLADNNEIDNGEITGLPPNLPAGSPIHVTFRLEDDGTLTVSAIEPSSGQNLKLIKKMEGVLSEAEVEEEKRVLLKKTVS